MTKRAREESDDSEFDRMLAKAQSAAIEADVNHCPGAREMLDAAGVMNAHIENDKEMWALFKKTFGGILWISIKKMIEDYGVKYTSFKAAFDKGQKISYKAGEIMLADVKAKHDSGVSSSSAHHVDPPTPAGKPK